LAADLQYAVEAPEGEQQGVCAAHAEGNVDDSSRCQSTCRDSPLSLNDMTLVSVCMHIEVREGALKQLPGHTYELWQAFSATGGLTNLLGGSWVRCGRQALH
jgi:hypothetical protein